MKEIPILFSGEMVRAILDSRKTQTRRIVKGVNAPSTSINCVNGIAEISTLYGDGPGHDVKEHFVEKTCPYGQAGDRLWVRETFYAYGEWERVPDEDGKLAWHFVDRTIEAGKRYQYVEPESLTKRRKAGVIGWYRRPSIFMPRAASRILLEITDVRVERLKDISEEDAIAEGMFFTDYGRNCFHGGGPTDVGDCPAPDKQHPQRNGWMYWPTTSHKQCLGSARFAYGHLWESLNGSGSWAANPWVWAISFKVLEKCSLFSCSSVLPAVFPAPYFLAYQIFDALDFDKYICREL